MSSEIAFTYADPADSWPRRALIRAVESLTGQPRIHRLYLENRDKLLPGESFWAACFRVMDIALATEGTAHLNWPREGPLVVIANHPFGVLDGLAISELVGRVRPDYRVLTNAVLTRAPETQPYLLPVDFAETEEALRTNLASRAAARAWLAQGGCVVLFPAGGVATTKTALGSRAVDLPWKPFLGALVQGGRAAVAPLWFDGQNSRLFQLASHIHPTLRLSLLFHEVRLRMGRDVTMRPGPAIPFAELAPMKDRQILTDHLRDVVEALGKG